MLGSPPALAVALPSLFAEDHDFLPAWSKALSLSPRLGPTVGASGVTGGYASTSAVGLDVFGMDSRDSGRDSPMAHAPGTSKSLDVGNGLSPILGPVLMSASPAPLEEGQNDLPGVFLEQHRSSFESSFNKYHHPPPVDVPTPRKSPTRRKLSHGDLPAPVSFDSVAALPAMSPETHAAAANSASGPNAAGPSASTSARSPVLPAPTLEEEQPAANFAHGLPSGLQRRATLGPASEEQDKGRIQAYAKLEFPSFDIYIQKLSVTIGRRPAAPPLRSSAALPFDDARAAGMSLEDYILSLTDAALVKREETLASIVPDTLAPLPASIKGKEKAVDDVFSEFVRSSPPPATTILAEAPLDDSVFSALPPTLSPLLFPAHPAPSPTDVDLGPLRAVSRQHARLSFDYDVGAWVLEVLGRNGVVVEGKWRAKGQKAILTKKTKIQIAERIFHFVLPTIDVVAVEADAAPERASKPVKTKVKDRTRLRVSGKSKGKGKVRRRANVEDASSSSLSEVSDSDVELSPLMQLSPELSVSPQKAASDAPAPRPAHSSAPLAPAGIELPALSRTTSAGKATPAPPAAPPVASTSAAPPSLAKARPPLPSKAPATRSSKKPKPPPKTASPAASHLALAALGGPSPGADEIDDARARAAMIAQILSGRGVAGMSNAALVRAAAEAQRRQSGKGKAPMRSAGKGPGKGKGLPPRSRRPSNASWDDDDDDSSSPDDDDSDHELLIEAFQEAVNMGHDIRGGGQGGGKHIVKRTASEATISATASPAPPPPAAAPAPKVAGKMPAKQPRTRRNASLSGAAGAVSEAPAASASPAPTPTTLSTNLPPLPLPSLPPAVLSPAPPTPALLSAASLPPLPSLISSAASPATPALNLPPLPKAVPAPPASSASTTSAAVSNTALPPAPAPAPQTSAIAPVPAIPAAPPKKRSHKKKVPPKDPPAGDAAGKEDGAAPAPAKPRPSPYAPAPLAPGAPLPDEAPADNRQAKPPYTYASLIAQAIVRSEAKKLTLHEVYDWIISRWPFFRDNQAGWQNSIRHNLTPARGFLKVLRRPDEPGKGSFWEIDPAQMPNFDGHHFRIKKTEGAAAVAAAASAAAAANRAKANAAPSASPGPAAAPSPAIVAAVEASTAAVAKPVASIAKAAPPASRPSSASPAPQSAAIASAQLSKPLPIVVSALPASFVPPTPPPESASAAATDELTASLLANPPIVLHEGTLILRPEIFSATLSDARLAELQKMPASAVLPILQAHVVQHFKDKLRTKGGAAAKPAPAKAPKATKAPKAAAKAPRSSATLKKPKSAAAPPAATAGTKRAREPDIDLTAAPASAKPTKVARKAAASTASYK